MYFYHVFLGGFGSGCFVFVFEFEFVFTYESAAAQIDQVISKACAVPGSVWSVNSFLCICICIVLCLAKPVVHC